MFSKEVLEKMSDEEITEEIDKIICCMADWFKPESEWKEKMMKCHQMALQKDDWFNKTICCSPILFNLLILKNGINELRQLINEENYRTSKENAIKNMVKKIESE